MQARTSTWSGSPEAIERWVEHVTTNVKPMVAGLAGNAGAYFFVDRDKQSGAHAHTVGQHRGCRVEFNQTADASRARTVAATGIELVERGAYEVVAHA